MRTGNCWLCGSPSNPKGIGGELERCEACVKRSRSASRKRWSDKNKERELEMKRAWDADNRDRKRVKATEWRKANMGRSNAAGKAWKKANPEALRVYQLRKYGLTVADYDAMLLAQEGRCAICQKPPTTTRPRLCVDHCHDSNEVRGLLCVACNAGLGNFQDEPANFLAAERYIQTHRRKRLKLV